MPRGHDERASTGRQPTEARRLPADAEDPEVPLTNAAMEASIRAYFDACTAADRTRLLGFFTADAVHYFPAGSPFGALRGAAAIADCWCHCVREWGSVWTVDRYLGDPARREAVIEWTHFKPKLGGYLRGDEWYRFEESGLISEIRAYYACPAQPGVSRHEIAEYPYATLGYPLAPHS